jgi:murein L,D-transpeptidase YafK
MSLLLLKQPAGGYISSYVALQNAPLPENTTDPAGTSAFHPWVQEPRIAYVIQGFLNFCAQFCVPCARRLVAFLLFAVIATPADAQLVRTSELSDAAQARQAGTLDALLSPLGLARGAPVFIRVFKQTSELEVWMENAANEWMLVHTWPVCAWSGELGPKEQEGDLQTPEGFYYITAGRMNPFSQWHLAMNLGYPNAYDQALGRTGSFIMIHGVCGSSGCLAMTNEGVEPIYGLVEAALNAGQRVVRVHIFPFRMTDAAMAEVSGHPWEDFWSNLREGYAHFEEQGSPPNVEVADGRYVFESNR